MVTLLGIFKAFIYVYIILLCVANAIESRLKNTIFYPSFCKVSFTGRYYGGVLIASGKSTLRVIVKYSVDQTQ